MTATNHVMTGAFLAVAVQRPLLAIPAAFLSHFLLDLFPHFGYGDEPTEARDRHKHFLKINIIDAGVAYLLYMIVPWLLMSRQTPIVTGVTMLTAQLPDAFWIFEYTAAQRRGHYRNRNWYLEFHKRIQWCERKWGAYVEVTYFGLIISSLAAIRN